MTSTPSPMPTRSARRRRRDFSLGPSSQRESHPKNRFMASLVIIGVLVPSAIALAQLTSGVAEKDGFTAVNRHRFAWQKTDASTSNQEFEPIDGLNNLSVCASSGVVAGVTLDMGGGTGQVRVVMREGRDTKRVLAPGPMSFSVSAGEDVRSFSFAKTIARRFSARFDVEWRTTSGSPVSLDKGIVDIAYKIDKGEGCG